MSPPKSNLYSWAKGFWSGQPPTMEDVHHRPKSSSTHLRSQSTSTTAMPPSGGAIYQRDITSGSQSTSTGISPSASAIYNRDGSTSASGTIYSDSGQHPYKDLANFKLPTRWGNARP